jgi:hypothetical protein
LENSNFTPALAATGLLQPAYVKKIYDIGGGLGGPLVRNTLWFYTAHRWWGTQEQVPGSYYNSTPNTLFYTPDLGRPAFTSDYFQDHSIRLTWQATPKQRVSVNFSAQNNCTCNINLNGTSAPEASIASHFYPEWNLQGTWSFPVTNRLLFQAGASYLNNDRDGLAQSGVSPTSIMVTNNATGFTYGNSIGTGPSALGVGRTSNTFGSRFSGTYVTGSHAFKFGGTTLSGLDLLPQNGNQVPLSYVFNNLTPVSLTQYILPRTYEDRLNVNLGLYAQDQWTVRKLTLDLGVRYDYLNEEVPAQVSPPSQYLPSGITVTAIKNVPNWSNLSPRLGAAYDLFGDGRTAVKFSVGRYMATEATATAASNNPIALAVSSATRTWSDANHNYVPDCNLASPLANGECGALSNSNFGTTNINTTWATDALSTRASSWQFSASVQHQLGPAISLEGGYFRTWYPNGVDTSTHPELAAAGVAVGSTNILMLHNLDVTPANYDPFCVTAPVNAQLPNGGGYQICGLFNLTPSKFGQVNNLITLASDYGSRGEYYNGLEASVNAHFGKGGLLTGGVSTGRTVRDDCVTADSPQKLFCRTVLPFIDQVQVKISGVYPLPWWGIQTSAVFQNLPGVPITANATFTNAQVFASLGRNLAGCPTTTGACSATVTVPLIEPNTLFTDRGTLLDFRLSKIWNMGRTRFQANLDVYNVANSSYVLAINTTYGSAWQRPTSVLDGRLFKFGGQFQF